MYDRNLAALQYRWLNCWPISTDFLSPLQSEIISAHI